tara:strand:- start:81 stop:359 length:279 start_codon:yes stop_codon:yes gene_type:complete
MISTILETLLSISLFITGGHLIDTKFGLHHYSDDDYKDIFYLKNKKSITKHCTRHSNLEDVKKRRRHGHNGVQETIYKVTKNEEKDSSVKTS